MRVNLPRYSKEIEGCNTVYRQAVVDVTHLRLLVKSSVGETVLSIVESSEF